MLESWEGKGGRSICSRGWGGGGVGHFVCGLALHVGMWGTTCDLAIGIEISRHLACSAKVFQFLLVACLILSAGA